MHLTPSPNAKILDPSKSKAFADDKTGAKEFQKRYSSYFDFHSSIFQSIQTERVPKQSFPPSDFGRLLELMQF